MMVSTTLLVRLALAAFLISPASAAWGTLIRDDDGSLDEGEMSQQDDYYCTLILVHSIFAALAFLLLVPIAVIISRFFKTHRVVKNGKWLYIHMGLHILTALFILIGTSIS